MALAPEAACAVVAAGWGAEPSLIQHKRVSLQRAAGHTRCPFCLMAGNSKFATVMLSSTLNSPHH